MAAGPIRRFTLLDAMVLLAATAVGLMMATKYGEPDLEENVLFRYEVGDDDRPVFPLRPRGGWTLMMALYYSPRATQILPPFLVAWSVAILVLRMVRPRPGLRDLLVQPGVVACVVGMAATGAGIATRLMENIYEIVVFESEKDRLPFDGIQTSPFYILDRAFAIAGPYAAFGVIVTWGVLGVSRRLKPEPTWIDRFGRAIGVLWVVVVLCHLLIDMEDLFWPISLDGPGEAAGGLFQGSR